MRDRGTDGKTLRSGSWILAVCAVGIAGASAAMLSNRPTPWTPDGRHLYAGALANLCVSLLLFLVASIPLRRGQEWAFWAYAAPFALYGLPVTIFDAIYAPRETLLATLAPEVLALAAATVGLSLCALALFGKKAAADA